MFIGIDFDNTIVCYDQLFYNLALEQKPNTEEPSHIQTSSSRPSSGNRLGRCLDRDARPRVWAAYGGRIALPGRYRSYSEARETKSSGRHR